MTELIKWLQLSNKKLKKELKKYQKWLFKILKLKNIKSFNKEKKKLMLNIIKNLKITLFKNECKFLIRRQNSAIINKARLRKMNERYDIILKVKETVEKEFIKVVSD